MDKRKMRRRENDGRSVGFTTSILENQYSGNKIKYGSKCLLNLEKPTTLACCLLDCLQAVSGSPTNPEGHEQMAPWFLA